MIIIMKHLTSYADDAPFLIIALFKKIHKLNLLSIFSIFILILFIIENQSLEKISSKTCESTHFLKSKGFKYKNPCCFWEWILSFCFRIDRLKRKNDYTDRAITYVLHYFCLHSGWTYLRIWICLSFREITSTFSK